MSDIRKSLGAPIYSRIDLFVEYKELSDDISKQLIEVKFNNIYSILSNEDKAFIDKENDLSIIKSCSKNLKNVREIDRVINEFVFARIINHKFKE